MEKEWFERWFGAEYKALYPYRNDAQAADQVKALTQACSASSSWNILDVGCGSGRHLRAFRAGGFGQAAGIDLSHVLLRDARATGVAVAQADMRQLPFSGAAFDLLVSFFTSFGYFATRDEDASTLREFCRVVKPGGVLFLDLLNPGPAMRALIPHDTHVIDGDTVQVYRSIEGDQVVKKIRCKNGESFFEERVRLYSLSDLKMVLENLQLTLVRVFGDEHGSDYIPESSPRMGLLLRKV